MPPSNNNNVQLVDDMSEYIASLDLHTTFSSLLQSILKAKPDDPIGFMIKELEANPVRLRRRPPKWLRGKIEALFKSHDKDKNGYLDRKEFKDVFNSLQEELGISDRHIKLIMAEADENADGFVEYKEFAPIAVEVIEAIYAKMDSSDAKEAAQEAARADAADVLLRGMTAEQLEDVLRTTFHRSDADRNGHLDRKEFLTCLQDSDLGFTHKEVNVLMSECDLDQDGHISYEEFAPLCFNILVEIMSRNMLAAPEDEGELRDFLFELLSPKVDNQQRILREDAEELLLGADLGLTRVQAAACMSDAEVLIMEEESIEKYEVQNLVETIPPMLLALWREWGYIE